MSASTTRSGLVLCILFHCFFSSSGALRVRVGVIHSPPYVTFKNSNTQSETSEEVASPAPPSGPIKNSDLSGFAINVWREVAEFDSQYFVVNSINELFSRLESNQLDVGIVGWSLQLPLPPSICRRRHREEEVGGFCGSIPYHRSIIRAMGLTYSQSRAVTIILALIDPTFLAVFFMLMLAMIGAAHIIWFLERRRNEGHFPKGYASGTFAGFYWSGITTATIGYGDKVPVTPVGRIFTLGWILFSLVLFNVLASLLISSITVQSTPPPPFLVQDLTALKVATLPDSTAMAIAYRVNVGKIFLVDLIEDGIQLLDEGKVDYVVGDQSILLSFNRSTNKAFVGTAFQETNLFYHLQATSDYGDLVKQYFPPSKSAESSAFLNLTVTILGSIFIVYLLLFCVVWPLISYCLRKPNNEAARE